MRHKMTRKFAALLTTAAMTLFSITPGIAAAAVTGTCSNTNTQSDSTNVCTNSVQYGVEVTNRNNADVTNQLTQNSNTGGNVISSVNGDVGYVTGGIQSASTMHTDVNANTTDVAAGLGNIMFTGSNSNTQSGSTNVVDNIYDAMVDVSNRNNLDVRNNVESTTNTGYNLLSHVNGDVSGITGNAVSTSQMMTDGNVNETDISGLGSAVFVNSNYNTQADSFNVATGLVRNLVEVTNRNDAGISNNAFYDVNSGNNILDAVNGDVRRFDSGSIGVVSDIDNGSSGLNQNDTRVRGGGGVAFSASNANTQSGSTNLATSIAELMAEIDNNNELCVTNSAYYVANSGYNGLTHVNGDVSALTGMIELGSVMNTEGNDNFTSLMGTGSLVSMASNMNTQSDSFNEASNTATHEVDVRNSNDAHVDNMASMFADTGYNFADSVNGDVGLRTGRISLANVMSSLLNTNETRDGIDLGMARMDADNLNTQSYSTNTTGISFSHEVDVHNDNDLDLLNSLFGEDESTGDNLLFDVNGDFGLMTGGVVHASHVFSDGNTSVNSL